MFALDPGKLLVIAVVALLVLGPDKLPVAARKASSLLSEFQQFRASLHGHIHQALGDHPVVNELGELRDGLRRVRDQADVRRFLPSARLGDPPDAATGPHDEVRAEP